MASQVLVKKYNFDLSPATIRAEMKNLDEEDLLAQPHHSAGRVPTTKAYRLFVDELLKEKKLKPKDEEKITKRLKEVDHNKVFSHQLAQILADFSHNLGFSGFFGGQQTDFHEAGLPWLFEDEELREPDTLVDILRGFDALEREFAYFFEEIEKETEIFIGEENPFKDLERCSLVVSGYKKKGKKGFIGILGPKRMDYARNIFLVKEIKKIIENI